MAGHITPRSEGQPLLSDTDVLVVDRHDGARISDAPAAATWPCPFCGLERRLDTAVPVRICNRIGPELARTAVACATCAGRVLVPVAQDERTRSSGLPARPAEHGAGHPGACVNGQATDE